MVGIEPSIQIERINRIYFDSTVDLIRIIGTSCRGMQRNTVARNVSPVRTLSAENHERIELNFDSANKHTHTHSHSIRKHCYRETQSIPAENIYTKSLDNLSLFYSLVTYSSIALDSTDYNFFLFALWVYLFGIEFVNIARPKKTETMDTKYDWADKYIVYTIGIRASLKLKPRNQSA